MPTMRSDARTTAARTARLLQEARPHRPPPDISSRAALGAITRNVIGFPRLRREMVDLLVGTIAEDVGCEAFDVIAGADTAGIPYAAWMATRLDLPMVYVRLKAKGFGRNAQVEGVLPTGSRALLVADLVAEAESIVALATSLRDAGATVAHVAAIVAMTDDRRLPDTLADAGLTLHALTGSDEVATAALTGNRPA